MVGSAQQDLGAVVPGASGTYDLPADDKQTDDAQHQYSTDWDQETKVCKIFIEI